MLGNQNRLTDKIMRQCNRIHFWRTRIGVMCLLTLIVGAVIGGVVYAQQPKKEPRQRIALNGFISHGTTGIPRWSLNETALSGEPGDLIILRTSAQPGERVEAGAYLFYRTLDRDDKPTGQWTGVPASQRGIDWQYRSKTLNCACAVVRFVNPSQKEGSFDLPLFLPYAAINLPAGRYQFTYLVQIRANNVLVDDFWTDHVVLGTVGSSGLVRQGIACCACTVADGPCLTPFRLAGTSDSLTPLPEPQPVPTPQRSEQ
jgi:hypothetical protein